MSGYMNEFSSELRELDRKVMEKCRQRFEEIDEIAAENSVKVLNAFRECGVGAEHLGGSTGYGYGDIGRDKLDEVFAKIVGAEDALCREQFMSGTHALTVAMFGMAKCEDLFMALTGDPYDTLMPVVRGPQSLEDAGVRYRSIPLRNGSPDYEAIADNVGDASVAYIQRSHGYDPDRNTLSCSDIGRIIDVVREKNPGCPVIVDNCYGEFCEAVEPIQAGADLIVGSMIKNPGGAVAPTGGYIAGRHIYVEKCAQRLTAPGTGREIGCWPAGHRDTFIGLSFAPTVTGSALKTGVYASALFEELGYSCNPGAFDPRPDITTVIRLNNKEKLIRFCKTVQQYSFVDSYAVPEPWEMPGYGCDVIMASGAFTGGSSIELSCDAPVREPYAVYLQGGTSFACSRYTLLKTAEAVGRA